MDAHELFWQLTRGVHFSKKNSKTNLKAKENDKENLKLKVEKTENAAMEDEEIENTDDLMGDFEGNSSCSGIDESEEEDDHNDVVVKDKDNNDDEEETVLEYLKGPLHLNKEELQKKKLKKKKKTVLSEEDRQKQLHAEMITTLRKENRITVLGKNIPDPIQNFEDLELESNGYKVMNRLIKNLALCNYPKPTPVQMQAIPIMLKGRHLMASAPTGSGKTIAFLTPIINDLKAPKKIGFRALILAPTRELAQQIYRECIRLAEKTALKIHLIKNTNQVAEKFGPNSAKKCDILISTPNRIRYLIQQEPPALDLKSVEWLVVDEADRLMDESQDNFKEQLDDIMAACSNTNKKMAFFSATYTVPVSKWVVKHLKNVIRLTVGQQNSATETVEQELLFVGSESGKLLAIRDMVRTGLKPPVLVFVQSKERAKQLFTELLYDGINVDVIHADRTQQQRDNCVKAFREGHIWVLICTELMGRGIDFKGVNLVINYDFPPSTISYIHRIGRTGRAGRPGKAITYYTQDDKPNLRKIAEIIKNSGGQVPDFLLTMKKPRKSEIKNYQNHAPKREDISTKIKPEGAQTKDEKVDGINKLIRKKEKQNKTQSYEMDKLQKKKKNLQKFNQKVQTNQSHLKRKRKSSLKK